MLLIIVYTLLLMFDVLLLMFDVLLLMIDLLIIIIDLPIIIIDLLIIIILQACPDTEELSYLPSQRIKGMHKKRLMRSTSQELLFNFYSTVLFALLLYIVAKINK